MPQEYVEGLEQIKSAPDVADLESKFGALVRAWTQLESISRQQHKGRKKELRTL